MAGVAFFALSGGKSLSETQRVASGMADHGILNAHQQTLRSQWARGNRYGRFHRAWPADGAGSGGDGRECSAVRAEERTMRSGGGGVAKSGRESDGAWLRCKGSGQREGCG